MTERSKRTGRFISNAAAKRQRRRNPTGAGYSVEIGGKRVFHPVRAWAGYNAGKVGETKGAKVERRPYRKPTLTREKMRELREYARRRQNDRQPGTFAVGPAWEVKARAQELGLPFFLATERKGGGKYYIPKVKVDGHWEDVL